MIAKITRTTQTIGAGTGIMVIIHQTMPRIRQRISREISRLSIFQSSPAHMMLECFHVERFVLDTIYKRFIFAIVLPYCHLCGSLPR